MKFLDSDFRRDGGVSMYVQWELCDSCLRRYRCCKGVYTHTSCSAFEHSEEQENKSEEIVRDIKKKYPEYFKAVLLKSGKVVDNLDIVTLFSIIRYDGRDRDEENISLEWSKLIKRYELTNEEIIEAVSHIRACR